MKVCDVLCRATLIAAFFAFANFLTSGKALAETEFCPAAIGLDTWHSFEGNPKAPSATFAYSLTANADHERTVRATITVATDHGWFTVSTPATSLALHRNEYRNDVVDFERVDYYSTPLFVTFPQKVTLKHAWVSSVTTLRNVFERGGTTQCDPTPYEVNMADNNRKKTIHDLVKIPADPPIEAPVSAKFLEAKAMASPKLSCGTPFTNATAPRPVQPKWPTGLGLNRSTYSDITVAINRDGSLAEAWLSAPSGNDNVDNAALKAARETTYTPASAMCRPVPSIYMFRAVFESTR